MSWAFAHSITCSELSAAILVWRDLVHNRSVWLLLDNKGTNVTDWSARSTLSLGVILPSVQSSAGFCVAPLCVPPLSLVVELLSSDSQTTVQLECLPPDLGCVT